MLRIGSALFVLGALAVAVPASAAVKSPAMESCSGQWSKMKTDNAVPAGQTWPKFWSDCSKAYAAAHPDPADAGKMTAKPAAMTPPPEPMAAPAPKPMAAPAPAPVATEAGLAVPASPEDAAKIDAGATTKTKKPQTPGQQAATIRIKACGAEWQAAKKAGTLPTGAKWPQYWSDCNKRLKAKGQ